MILSFIRKPKYIMFAVAAIAVLVSGGIITSSMLMGQTRATFESQGANYASVHNEAEDTVVMKVNNYEVTYPEYAVMKARFETNLANMKTHIEVAVPDNEWTEPEGTADNNPVRPMPAFTITDGFKKMAATGEKHGADAGALGALILEYALCSIAVEEGYGLSNAEVAAEVADMKAFYEETYQPLRVVNWGRSRAISRSLVKKSIGARYTLGRRE